MSVGFWIGNEGVVCLGDEIDILAWSPWPNNSFILLNSFLNVRRFVRYTVRDY